jgi:hypothetical protein
MKTTLAVLAVSALALAPLRAETVLKGDLILSHQIGQVLLDFTKLVKEGKPDEAAKLQSERVRKRRTERPAPDRKESDAFLKDYLPAPDLLEASIRKGGTVAIEGNKAELTVFVTSSKKNADGSITGSSETMALLFANENGEWRLDQ